jgi:hypothetical protein
MVRALKLAALEQDTQVSAIIRRLAAEFLQGLQVLPHPQCKRLTQGEEQ